MAQGKLIVLEGVEGAGKTTQLKALHQWLKGTPGPVDPWRQAGCWHSVLITREPGGTPLGRSLRSLLLEESSAHQVNDRTELLMYAADRAQHVDEVIRPALARGDWVLCDRFVDSTVAYQGYGRGLDLSLIERLNRIATDGLNSDLTLWLRLNVTVGLDRSQRRGTLDRMESADLAFHQRVQQGFETLAAAHPHRIVPIDAAAPPEQVSEQIQRVLLERLHLWYGRRP